MPITDSKNPVRVRWGYGYDSTAYTAENYYLSPEGLVELTFYPPNSSNFSTLGLEVYILFSLLLQYKYLFLMSSGAILGFE